MPSSRGPLRQGLLRTPRTTVPKTEQTNRLRRLSSCLNRRSVAEGRRFYPLQAFTEGQAKDVLTAMLKPFYTDDPIAKQQIEEFQTAIVIELLRPPRDKRLNQDDEKTILPVELQTIGMMLEAIGDRN